MAAVIIDRDKIARVTLKEACKNYSCAEFISHPFYVALMPILYVKERRGASLAFGKNLLYSLAVGGSNLIFICMGTYQGTPVAAPLRRQK